MVMYEEMPMTFVRRDGRTSPAVTSEVIALLLGGDRRHYDNLITDIPYREDEFSQLFPSLKREIKVKTQRGNDWNPEGYSTMTEGYIAVRSSSGISAR